MNLEIPTFAAYIGSWVATTGGIYMLFDQAEQTLTPEARSSISKWILQPISGAKLRQGVRYFGEIIDRIVGNGLFTFRAFIFSLSVTLVALFSVSYFAAATRGYINPFQLHVTATILGLSLPVALRDYLSLIESRVIMRRISECDGFGRILFWLIIDLLLSVFLGIIPFLMHYFLSLSDMPMTVDLLWKNFIYGGMGFGSSLVDPKQGWLLPYYLIMFATSLFTSIWLYGYVLSRWTISFLMFLGVRLKILTRYIDFETKPLKALGFVAMVIVSIFYAAFPLLS